MTKVAAACCLCLLALGVARADETPTAGITLSEDGSKGVATEAQAYSASSGGGSTGGAPGGGVVIVGIQPHTCAPVLSEGGRGGSGLPLDLTFSDATSDCVSFAAPPPPGAPQDPATLSPSEVAAIAADRAMALAESPRLRVSPSAVGLTGLRSYFWLASEPRPVSATASVPGLTVTAEAYPVSYIWSFGDGAEISTSHSGRKWRRGRPGNIGYVYETKDRYDITVRVIWEARWRVGSGAWRPLGYFANESSVTYPVRQARSVLTRSRR